VTFDQSKWVWMNGQVIPWRDATTHVSAHALHYGSGILRVFVAMRQRMVQRSFVSMLISIGCMHQGKSMGLSFHTRKMNYRGHLRGGSAKGFRSCYVRPLASRKCSLGVHPGTNPVESVILAWPWAPYLGAEGLKQGVRVTVSPWRKFQSRMIAYTAKACGQYLNSMWL